MWPGFFHLSRTFLDRKCKSLPVSHERTLVDFPRSPNHVAAKKGLAKHMVLTCRKESTGLQRNCSRPLPAGPSSNPPLMDTRPSDRVCPLGDKDAATLRMGYVPVIRLNPDLVRRLDTSSVLIRGDTCGDIPSSISCCAICIATLTGYKADGNLPLTSAHTVCPLRECIR